MMNITDSLVACEDCYVAIETGDYTGMSEKQAAATRAGIERIANENPDALLVGGDDLGFRWTECGVCRNGKGGNKHEVLVQDVGE